MVAMTIVRLYFVYGKVIFPQNMRLYNKKLVYLQTDILLFAIYYL